MLLQEACQPPSALQVACKEGKRQGQYQSFAYPILCEYSSEILPLETLHACLTEGTMLKTAQGLTSYKIPKQHLIWVPYATLCMLLPATPKQNKLVLYIHQTTLPRLASEQLIWNSSRGCQKLPTDACIQCHILCSTAASYGCTIMHCDSIFASVPHSNILLFQALESAETVMLLSDGMRCITAAGLACTAAVKDPLRCLPRAGAAAWGLDDAKGALPSSCPSLPTMFPFPFGALPSLLAIKPPFALKAVPSLW